MGATRVIFKMSKIKMSKRVQKNRRQRNLNFAKKEQRQKR